MAYPATINALTEKSDGPSQIIYAAHMNAIRTALLDLVTALGNAPQGNLASVEARLDVRIDDYGKLKNPQQLVTVGKTNADYTTITAALAAITDAAGDKIYTILVHPGIYTEAVVSKDYIDLIGVDPASCKIITAAGHGLRISSGHHVQVSNLWIETTEGDSNGLVNQSDYAYFHNCDFKGKYADIDLSSGMLYMAFCRTHDSGVLNEFTNGGIVAKHCWFQGEDHIITLMGGRSSEIYSCRIGPIGGDAVDLNQATASFNHCVIDGHYGRGLTITNCTPKFSHCRIIGGGNNYAVRLENATANPTILHSTLLKGGSASNAVYAEAENTDVRVALCTMNTALHANCNNLIETPYNVIDSDIT